METGLIGGVEKRQIVISEYKREWPKKFLKHKDTIQKALGERALSIEHVGSTAVPGLAAKDVIDIDLTVADSSDEAAYLPELIEAGYQLRVREPDWQEHRMVRTTQMDVHIHIFSPGAEELRRHRIFRDRLRVNAVERNDYESVKRELAKHNWEDMNAYAAAKSEIVERVLRSAMGREERKEIPKTYRLESERCVLRCVSSADIPHIYEAAQYPKFTDGMCWEPPACEEELIPHHEENLRTWGEGVAFTFSIDSKETGELLGRISIRKQESAGEWDLGFWTHPRHQGHGYMTEVVAVVIEFGFNVLEAKTIVACHALWNKASESVLHKNGLRFIEYHAHGFQKKGEWVEENMLGIRRSQWELKQAHSAH